MKLPNILHPKTFQIDGFTFQVVSYCPLTDRQASKIAMHFYRTHKLKKAQQKKILKVITLFDEESVNLL